MLNCSTNSSLVVDSIELLDADRQTVIQTVTNTSLLNYKANITTQNVTYICRVNSTLGSQIYRLNINDGYEAKGVTTPPMTLVPTVSPSPVNIPLTPIAASAATILALLLIITLLACIILLR